jgi:hypothetical protein
MVGGFWFEQRHPFRDSETTGDCLPVDYWGKSFFQNLGPIPIETAPSGWFGSAPPGAFIPIFPRHRCMAAPWGDSILRRIRNIPGVFQVTMFWSPFSPGHTGGLGKPASLRDDLMRSANGCASRSRTPGLTYTVPFGASLKHSTRVAYCASSIILGVLIALNLSSAVEARISSAWTMASSPTRSTVYPATANAANAKAKFLWAFAVSGTSQTATSPIIAQIRTTNPVQLSASGEKWESSQGPIEANYPAAREFISGLLIAVGFFAGLVIGRRK